MATTQRKASLFDLLALLSDKDPEALITRLHDPHTFVSSTNKAVFEWAACERKQKTRRLFDVHRNRRGNVRLNYVQFQGRMSTGSSEHAGCRTESLSPPRAYQRVKHCYADGEPNVRSRLMVVLTLRSSSHERQPPIGIDAALYIVSELKGVETAERVSREIEYTWHRNANEDPFADVYEYTRQG